MKMRGRPPKAEASVSPTALISVEIMKEALRLVAKTTVDEMTIPRFVESAASELDAVFAGERPRAEVQRKLLPILISAGWQGQEADIEAMLVAFEKQQAAKDANAAKTSSSLGITGRAVRRTAKVGRSAQSDTPGGQVASVPQPQSVDDDDDGYETFGLAEYEAQRDAEAAVAAQPIPVPTDTSGTAYSVGSAQNAGHGTQGQRS